MLENFKFNKKFGQNFISDKNLLSAIVSDAEITKEDEVLEIGAGAGTLTKAISEKAKKVVSYEIDKNLTEHLKSVENSSENIKIYIEDALKKQINEIEKDFEKEYHLIANLPYYITTPLIFKFLEESDKCKSLTVMVQKEVAERFCASCGEEGYGIPSIILDYFCESKITRIVSRKMFFPMPNVDSAVLCIRKKEIKSSIEFRAKFKKLVALAFSMRRKTLYNNLKPVINSKDEFENILKLININNVSVRAEQLTTEDFIKLTKAIFKIDK